jgi:hypothetical protein
MKNRSKKSKKINKKKKSRNNKIKLCKGGNKSIKIIINNDEDNRGFFSHFNQLLCALVDNPETTVIEYNLISSPRYISTYYVKEGEEILSKLLEKYDLNKPVTDTISLVKFDNNSYATKLYFDAVNNFNSNRIKLQPFNDAYNKFIKIKPNILDKIESHMNILKENSPEQLIGVLVRSKAVHSALSKNTPSYEKYLNAINIENKNKKTKYFFCIDNNKDLEYYKKALTPNYYLKDLPRSLNNDEDAPHMNPNLKSLEELENIFIQVVILSKCDILVHCNSNMAISSLSMNMNVKSVFIS